MNVRAGLFSCFFLLLLALTASAEAMSVDDPCPKTSTSIEWSDVCFKTTKAGRQVQQQYRKNLVFDRKGFAAVVITAPAQLVAVNRRGKVVRTSRNNLSGFSFEPSDHPIARFGYVVASSGDRADFKCGFFQRGKNFKVMVPPVYDQCDEFVDGKALVCIGCTSHCESGDCHETDFIHGEGLVITSKNEVLRRFPLPLLPRCARGAAEQTGQATCRPLHDVN